MKKSAIVAALASGSILAGCGKVDTITLKNEVVKDVKSEIKQELTTTIKTEVSAEIRKELKAEILGQIEAQSSANVGALKTKLDFYTRALSINDSDLHRVACGALKEFPEGIDLLTDFAVKNIDQSVCSYALESLKSYSGNPKLGKSLETILAVKAESIGGGNKLSTYFRNMTTAIQTMVTINPKAYAPKYLEFMANQLPKRDYSISYESRFFDAMTKCHGNVPKEDILKFMPHFFKAYKKMYYNNAQRYGYDCMVKLTGQTLGSNKSDSKERDKTLALYEAWYKENAVK